MSFIVADIYDDNESALNVVEPLFQAYGKSARFAGPIRTIECFEDNSKVREALQEPGDGAVLVVDGGGSLRCALVGGNLGQLAVDNGWAGIVVNGCIRDSVEINEQAIGVRAINTNPTKSVKRGQGGRDESVHFGGVSFVPGHWLYADEDGVAVSAEKLI